MVDHLRRAAAVADATAVGVCRLWLLAGVVLAFLALHGGTADHHSGLTAAPVAAVSSADRTAVAPAHHVAPAGHDSHQGGLHQDAPVDRDRDEGTGDVAAGCIAMAAVAGLALRGLRRPDRAVLLRRVTLAVRRDAPSVRPRSPRRLAPPLLSLGVART